MKPIILFLRMDRVRRPFNRVLILVALCLSPVCGWCDAGGESGPADKGDVYYSVDLTSPSVR